MEADMRTRERGAAIGASGIVLLIFSILLYSDPVLFGIIATVGTALLFVGATLLRGRRAKIR